MSHTVTVHTAVFIRTCVFTGRGSRSRARAPRLCPTLAEPRRGAAGRTEKAEVRGAATRNSDRGVEVASEMEDKNPIISTGFASRRRG